MSSALLLATTPTIPDLMVFIVGVLMIFVGAAGVLISRNPVHAALSLVLTLFGIAVLFIEQQAEFLAAVQVIVYAGAVVVLFLFVIMFLGVDRSEDIAAEPLVGQRPFAVGLVAVMVASIIALGSEAKWAGGSHSVVGVNHGPYQNVYDLGKTIFTTYLFAFEATSALLIIAVVGAVVLARRSGSAQADPSGSETSEELAGPSSEEVER